MSATLEQFTLPEALEAREPPELTLGRRDAVRMLVSLGNAEPRHTTARDLATWPLLAELARTGDKLWFYGGKEQMELLELVLAELPELTVVLNHLGFWPSALAGGFWPADAMATPTRSRSADNPVVARLMIRQPHPSGHYRRQAVRSPARTVCQTCGQTGAC